MTNTNRLGSPAAGAQPNQGGANAQQGQGGANTQQHPDMDAIVLREFHAVESNPAIEREIAAIQERMRVDMNVILKGESENTIGGNQILHNPAGNNYVQIRENLNFRTFQKGVVELLHPSLSNITDTTKQQMYGVLKNHTLNLTTLSASQQVPAAAPVAVPVPEDDDADEPGDEDAPVVVQAEVPQPKAWYDFSGLRGMGGKLVSGTKWLSSFFNVFDNNFWMKPPPSSDKK